MELERYREEIDRIDCEIKDLVEKRMKVVKDIAEYKKENGIPILDAKREREKLAALSGETDGEIRRYMTVLYSLMFELSRSYQGALTSGETELFRDIRNSIDSTPRLFPEDPSVACQGVEGAFSQIACEKMFRTPKILYMNTFDSVFSAVENGFCKYGVIPLENSTAGSVKKVYDLMVNKHFYIVRSTRIRIEHSLLAKPGTDIQGIKEIFSHEQAINQCAGFLSTLGNGVKVTCCENTAVAAKKVAKSDRRDVAALASYGCAELYGLECLKRSVEDSANNHTRFICISKDLEIYPGADKTSLMMVLPHRPGALYKALARFYALGINLIKLESRPIPGRDFEFTFYFDLETSVYSDEFVKLMCDMDGICEEFRYLGSYSEVL